MIKFNGSNVKVKSPSGMEPGSITGYCKRQLGAFNDWVKGCYLCFTPYIAFILNLIIPGSGFWFLGNKKTGLIFFIIALINLSFVFANEDLGLLAIYIPLSVLAACIAFHKARKKRTIPASSRNIERLEETLKDFSCILLNMLMPGFGLFLLGEYIAGTINFVVYLVIVFLLYLPQWLLIDSELSDMGHLIPWMVLFVHIFCGRVAYLINQQNKETNETCLRHDAQKSSDDENSGFVSDPKRRVLYARWVNNKCYQWIRIIYDFLWPFVAVLFNLSFPGAGFWFIGKWRLGFLNIAGFIIIAGEIKYLAYSTKGIELFVCFMSYSCVLFLISFGCLLFSVASEQNAGRVINRDVTEIHEILQNFFAPIINFFNPGVGFWLAGFYRAGAIIQVVYHLAVFTIIFCLGQGYVNEDIVTLKVLGVPAGIVQLFASYYVSSMIKMRKMTVFFKKEPAQILSASE